MKNILVTGGCGYIGRNMVKSLLKNNYNVIVVDSLINSSAEAIIEETTFYQIDIRDEQKINEVFSKHDIDVVMDFAALLDVEESWDIPLEYNDVNVNGLIVLLKAMAKYNVQNIVFSSTAAVYESSDEILTEESSIKPNNPYGMSKYYAEQMLNYYSTINNFNYVIFRYFNVVGSSKKGVSWDKFSTVVPKILTSLQQGNDFVVNGTDYDTLDGSPVRDYIHMEDLISAHQLVINNFKNVDNGVYNLSVGNGTTVIELFNSITDTFNVDATFISGARRKGDIAISVASNKKIKSFIDWEIKYPTINDMVEQIKTEN